MFVNDGIHKIGEKFVVFVNWAVVNSRGNIWTDGAEISKK
jgi:hypothetical protein